MSVLGIKLRTLVDENKINIYQVAKRANIDRSTIHKIMSADRFPSSEFMKKLINTMMLTPEERNDLWQAYEMQKIGEFKYHQRNQIKSILEMMDATIDMLPMPQQIFPKTDVFVPEDFEIIRGEIPINQLAENIIYREINIFENAKLNFYMPCNNDFFFKSLYFQYIKSKNLKIKCVLGFEKDIEKHGKKNKNLQALQTLIPFLLFPENRFEAHYIYEYVPVIKPPLAAMPYYIITSDCVITFSADAKIAVLHKNQELRTCYQGIFEQFLQGATSLLKRMDSVEQITKHDLSMAGSGANGNEIHLLRHQPCHARYFNKKTLEARIADDKPAIFFTENGLEELADTGQSGCVSGLWATTCIQDERRRLIENILLDVKSDTTSFRMVNQSKLKIPKHVFLNIYSGRMINISTCDLQESGKANIIFIQEESIVNAFDDFIASMKESDLLHTREYTIRKLEKILHGLGVESVPIKNL